MKADIHLHSSKMIPFPVRTLYNFKHRKTMLPPFHLKDMKEIGLDFAIINGIGDPMLNEVYSLRSNFQGLKNQIKKLVKEINKFDNILYNNFESIEKGIKEEKPVCFLALEGADFLENNIERLHEIYDLGIRGLGLVHFSDNCIGKINTDIVSMVVKARINEIEEIKGGLTDFGKEVVKEMNKLHMEIDLAHASSKMLYDVLKISNHPVLVSHTGARSIQDFSRYLTDEEIVAISQKGGLIGLWPFYFRGKGMKNMDDFILHANHLKNLVNVENIAIGTDANGLPGALKGYKFEKDFFNFEKILLNAGFDKRETSKIMGDNIIEFLRKIS
jgi:membrane dipeptidase